MDTYRHRLLELLADYGQRYPLETATVDRFRGFVETYPDCFQRELALGHVTGSAWLSCINCADVWAATLPWRWPRRGKSRVSMP